MRQIIAVFAARVAGMVQQSTNGYSADVKPTMRLPMLGLVCGLALAFGAMFLISRDQEDSGRVIFFAALAVIVAAYVGMHVQAVRLRRYYKGHPEDRATPRQTLIRFGLLGVLFVPFIVIGVSRDDSSLITSGVLGLAIFGMLCLMAVSQARRDRQPR